ncbi:MAG: hypothetical protein EBU46_09360 [Nitrosomonadaceae bacterium]|nr:hypothetical protein [Nitrosomonadaceae bacterium]
MKLSAAANTNDGEILIATYFDGGITFSRNDGTGLTTHVGSLGNCRDLEAVCVASLELLVKLQQRGLALSDNSRIDALQQDLRKLTLKHLVNNTTEDPTESPSRADDF